MHGEKSAKFWKNKYFPYLWQFLQGSMSVFLKISVFWGWFLKIFWSQVTNNDVISEICIFLGVEMLEFHVVNGVWVSFLCGVFKLK